MRSPLLSWTTCWLTVLLYAYTDGAWSVEDPYAEDPYWYRPGHPVDPADTAEIEVAEGFVVERVLEVPEEMGSWVALCVDGQGRLIASSQHGEGLYRVTPPQIGVEGASAQVERLSGEAGRVGWAHGLLYAFDSLYVTVAEENDLWSPGVYRLSDSNGDDQFDRVETLFEMTGAGEHGPHGLLLGPDGRSIYLMGGNGTMLPDGIDVARPVATEGIDHLMPPGFESSPHTLGGWVLRFDPNGNSRELVASGLRNCYDFAFDKNGELFTFDSDDEWDLGAPWYRPTRVLHVVGGGEYGWRPGVATWPDHFEDGAVSALAFGPSSPTGMVFGYGTDFPSRYQNALFLCDWTFGTIHAAHLSEDGATFKAESEPFLGGLGLPVTDVVVGADGSLYFAVGGRRLRSALYRARYVGETSSDPGPSVAAAADRELVALRRSLELEHGRSDGAGLGRVWSFLGHEDRAIRFAARVAVESRPVSLWRDRALADGPVQTRLMALLALARQGDAADLQGVVEALVGVEWAALDAEKRLRALRAGELAMARLEGEAAWKERWRKALRSSYPDPHPLVNRELARLLCYMGDSSMIDPLLERMREDQGKVSAAGMDYFARNPKYGQAVQDMLESAPMQERMRNAMALLWVENGWSEEQRQTYFELIAEATAFSKGGHLYSDFWDKIRQAALAQVDDEARLRFEAIAVRPFEAEEESSARPPEGPGRSWTVAEALAVVEQAEIAADLKRGEELFEAVGCYACHRLEGKGGVMGPDLTALRHRFGLLDMLEAIIEPSKAVSDQYRMIVVETSEGRAYSGRVVARDAHALIMATNLLRPSQTVSIPLDQVKSERSTSISTMPAGLIDGMNEQELRDLMAFLMRGGALGE